MHRRELLQRVSLLLGGVLSPQLSAGLLGQVTNAGPSPAPSALEQTLVAELADTLIPPTDTPGAKASGVEHFILRVLRDCYRREEQERFFSALNRFHAGCVTKFGKPFAELAVAQRAEAVLDLAKADKEFFKNFRQLTIAGYFSSENGATKALEYLPVPGRFEGDTPLKPGQKTWAL